MTRAPSIPPFEPGPGERPTCVRYFVLAGLAFAMMSAYLTRIMSAANTTIAAEFNLNHTDAGTVLASFALGYFWFQVPGGWLGSRFGARTVLPTIALGWSLATIWVSVARTAEELSWARVALGLAQAGLVPCSAKVIADWFPVRERGIASAVMGSSMQVGAITANGLTALVISQYGWRTAYLSYSLTGIVWAIVFYAWFRNRPREHPATNRSEQRLILGLGSPAENEHGDSSFGEPAQDAASGTAQETVPGLRAADGNDPLSDPVPPEPRAGQLLLFMALSASLWGIAAQAFFRAFGYEFFTTWFPAYLERGHQVQMVSAGLLTMPPLLGYGLGSIAGGLLVDALLTRTGSRRISRCGVAAAALGISGVCTLAAAWAASPPAAVAVLSIGSFAAGLAGPAAWAATIDVSGKYTGVVVGLMNMAGNIGAYVCPKVVGRLFSHIEEGSAPNWNLVLYLFVAINLAGALCWLFLDPNRSVVERPRM